MIVLYSPTGCIARMQISLGWDLEQKSYLGGIQTMHLGKKQVNVPVLLVAWSEPSRLLPY